MSLSQVARDFYRTFLDSSSAGGFVSGKGKEDRQSYIHELLCEFKNHKDGARKFNEGICHERLTAVVSVTINFIDALRRAFNKLYGGDKPEQISRPLLLTFSASVYDFHSLVFDNELSTLWDEIRLVNTCLRFNTNLDNRDRSLLLS